LEQPTGAALLESEKTKKQQQIKFVTQVAMVIIINHISIGNLTQTTYIASNITPISICINTWIIQKFLSLWFIIHDEENDQTIFAKPPTPTFL
jgi:hypothetical protein